MKKSIRIIEVGARDGLQNEPHFKELPEEELVRIRSNFIMDLAKAGAQDLEAGAFVRPDRVPQMNRTDKVLSTLQTDHPEYWSKKAFWVLVPNEKGLDSALEAKAKHISVLTATSDSFNQANIGMSVVESLEQTEKLIRQAKKEKLVVRAYISTVWGCPYEGKIKASKTAQIAGKLLEVGADEISLGDTIGVATPTEVSQVLQECQKDWPLAVHFHDTRGTAISNCLRAIEEGIYSIDSSAGGLGGCPYAKGAPGNLATEDILYMLHGMGFSTGIDIEKVCEANKQLGEKLPVKFPSRYYSAWKAKQKIEN